MSTRPKVRTTTVARVSLTVEVHVGSWGPDCDMAQVYRQASESAIGKLRRAFERDDTVQVLGVGKVHAITTSLEVTR